MRSAVVRSARNGLAYAARPPARLATPTPLWGRSGLQSYRSFTATASRRDEERKWSTPLAKQLTEAINVSPPETSGYGMKLAVY